MNIEEADKVDDFSNSGHLVARAIGALAGVIASMMLLAPESTRNAFYRLWVGVTMGFIFAPVAPFITGFGWLAGDSLEFSLARGAAVAFPVWFVLEVIVRLLGRNDWIVKLLREIAEKRAGNGGQ